MKRPAPTPSPRPPWLRYVLACGGVLLLCILAYVVVLRLDVVREGVAQSRLIKDDVVRRSEFYWLSQVGVLVPMVGAGLFCMAALMLEEPLLGPRPKEKKDRPKTTLEFAAAFAFYVLVIRTSSFTLEWDLYAFPVLVYATVLAWFILRLRRRTDLFPPKPQPPHSQPPLPPL